MTRDWRDLRIEELERALIDRDRMIAELRAVVSAQAAQIAALTAKVIALETRLNASSRNSSRPPSSDGPAVRKSKSGKKPSGRPPGGQPGHKRHERPLVPVEEVDKVVSLAPNRCEVPCCKALLTGSDPNPVRHQVFELPKVVPFVSEYRLHALDCECGHTTRAALPTGVPTRAFGPNVDATVAVLMGVYRLGKRPVVEFMRDMYGLTMCLGSVIACQNAASEALSEPFTEAKAFTESAPVKHADETGWRQARARAWLWTVVTPAVTVFMIQARRNMDAARALLGAVFGVLVTDRHGAYNLWSPSFRQFCWAHLKRDVVAMAERGGDSAVVAEELLHEIHRMFAWWHRLRDGGMKRATFQVYMRSLRKRFELLLERGTRCTDQKTARTCIKIVESATSLWTFVRIVGVEPTNNVAEQRVRHGVILRKTSYGTHSEKGSRFIERILTAHATLRSQRRNVLRFVQDACRARLNGTAPPSLLPQAPSARPVAIAA